MSQIKDCLIVAAGQGTRLKGIGDSKPLVELAGKTLIEHAMSSAISAGVERFVVITGYQAKTLTVYLNALAAKTGWQIEAQFNPDYLKQNGLSVLAGAPLLRDDFYLAMCDHLVEPALYQRLAKAKLATGAVGLGVDLRLDNPMVDIDDVTKVEIHNGLIKNIGKNIPNYCAYDTGIFRAGQSLFAAIRTSAGQSGNCSISGAMELLAQQNKAVAIDTGSAEWIDVDSPEMHHLASKWLAEQSVL